MPVHELIYLITLQKPFEVGSKLALNIYTFSVTIQFKKYFLVLTVCLALEMEQ